MHRRLHSDGGQAIKDPHGPRSTPMRTRHPRISRRASYLPRPPTGIRCLASSSSIGTTCVTTLILAVSGSSSSGQRFATHVWSVNGTRLSWLAPKGSHHLLCEALLHD